MKDFTLETRDVPGGRKLVFSGIIDAAARDDILSCFNTIDARNIILDFENAQRINSMGIATILKVLKEFSSRDGSIYYLNLSRLNLKLFKMMGLLKLGVVCDTEQAALQSFK